MNERCMERRAARLEVVNRERGIFGLSCEIATARGEVGELPFRGRGLDPDKSYLRGDEKGFRFHRPHQ